MTTWLPRCIALLLLVLPFVPVVAVDTWYAYPAECQPERPACSPGALGERVVQAAKQFAAGRSQHDDIALVGFGRTG